MPTAIVIDKYQKNILRKKDAEKMKEAYWSSKKKIDETLSTLVKLNKIIAFYYELCLYN